MYEGVIKSVTLYLIMFKAKPVPLKRTQQRQHKQGDVKKSKDAGMTSSQKTSAGGRMSWHIMC